MKNVSRAQARAWDALSDSERERFDRMIIEEQQRRAQLVSVAQLGEALNLSKQAVSRLPLPFVYLTKRTARGRRRVKSVHADDLRAFLSNLNETFADFDPFAERLLRASDEVQDFESISLNARVKRYRLPKSSIADAIMQS